MEQPSSTITLFDTLVLSGGGVKGIGQLGVLHYYYEKNLLDLSSIKEFAGTSVGSVICLLLICGYTPMEIFQRIYTIDSFFKAGGVHNIWDLFKNFGLMSIEPFIESVRTMVLEKLGKNPTLSELKRDTGKTLIVSAVNISKMCLEYFSPETKPHLTALDAVKISCNLPLVFQRIRYNGDYYVDGGMADNFPIASIDPDGKNILGIVVTGKDNAGGDDFVNYLFRLMVFPINIMTQLRSKGAGPNVKLIEVSFDDLPILELAVESKRKMEIFMKGYKEARKEEGKQLINVEGWSWDEGPELVEWGWT